MAVEYTCCGTEFFIRIVIIVLLVVFAGLMSGLTLGLMSLSLVDLEVLAKSGTPQDRKHAGTVLYINSSCFLFFIVYMLMCLILRRV
jgi:metal transporter CNNM